MINKLATEIHQNAKDKGFYEEPKNIGEMLCLIHGEVSEALEALRTNNTASRDPRFLHELKDNGEFRRNFEAHCKDSFEDELADVIIRVMDLSAYKKIDLENHIKAKMRYNEMRPRKHGKEF